MFKTILVHLPPRRILLYPMAPSCLFSISLLRPQCFDCVRSVLIPRQSRNFTSVSSNDLNGLFQLPNLYKAQDFQQLTQDAIVKCEEIKRKIYHSSAGLQTLVYLDDLSNTVCSVIDVAELCRNVHPEESFRSAASNCFTELSDYIQQLNTDVSLYQQLYDVTENKELMNTFTEEQKRMAILLRKEFERDGIHLELFERRRFISLQNDITRLSMKFQHTIHTAREYIEVPEKKIKGIPSSILAACERQSSSGTYKVPTDLHVMNTILKWIADPQVRKEMYLVGNSCAKENLEILDALRQKRHELAKLLGFESYVDFATCDRMIRTPETILTFLKNLSQKLMYKANQELQLILQAKQKLEGAHETQVYLWDLPYYMGMLKAKHFQIDSRIISSYFPLEHCIEGLHLICEKLFGVQLKQVSMGKYEAWHSDVKKLVVLNHKKEILGHIYFDLYPRSHKYNHAAHFTIRCGKKNGPNKYQTPIVALVCNFTKPAPHTPSLLNHSEVETLFHEFGHAMHSLLSRTEFQHLSGTRAQLDFVETPSHLFEYFTWDYRVVKEFALHHKTKEPIPEEMMINLKKSKHMFAAMDTQTQCLYSLLDLKVFGSQPLECDPPTTTETLKVLQGQHTLIPHTPNTYWHTRFGHLIGYGAGYYSYLYARVFASNIWNACFHEDPLSREAGKKIFQEMLIHGGAKDPQVMLRDLLGEEPSAERYLTELEVLEDEKYT